MIKYADAYMSPGINELIRNTPMCQRCVGLFSWYFEKKYTRKTVVEYPSLSVYQASRMAGDTEWPT